MAKENTCPQHERSSSQTSRSALYQCQADEQIVQSSVTCNPQPRVHPRSHDDGTDCAGSSRHADDRSSRSMAGEAHDGSERARERDEEQVRAERDLAETFSTQDEGRFLSESSGRQDTSAIQDLPTFCLVDVTRQTKTCWPAPGTNRWLVRGWYSLRSGLARRAAIREQLLDDSGGRRARSRLVCAQPWTGGLFITASTGPQ